MNSADKETSEPKWAVLFDDTERPPDMEVLEEAARFVFAQRLINWSCYLFCSAELLDGARKERDTLATQVAEMRRVIGALLGGWSQAAECNFQSQISMRLALMDARAALSEMAATEAEKRARDGAADTRRLDWLESQGLVTHNHPHLAGVNWWWAERGRQRRWTARRVSSEYGSAREAIDAAMEFNAKAEAADAAR